VGHIFRGINKSAFVDRILLFYEESYYGFLLISGFFCVSGNR